MRRDLGVLRNKNGKANPEYDRERKNLFKKLGICPRCSNPKEDKKLSLCSSCLESKRVFASSEEQRKHSKEFLRRHVIGYAGRKPAIRGLDKRAYPDNNCCEICFRQRKLSYHHWDTKNPNLGIWVCVVCHVIVECFDKGVLSSILNTYLDLKTEIETCAKPLP